MDASQHPPESPAKPGTGPLVGAALGVGLVAAALALALFVLLGYQVRSGGPIDFDLAVRAWVRSRETPELSAVMWAASFYGAPSRLLPLGLIAVVVFLVRGWRRGAVLVLVTLVGSVVLDLGLKDLFARARPQSFFDYYLTPKSYSFPSGHALFAVCFFGGLAALVSHRLWNSIARILVWAIALVLILLIGISRVYLGVHYPTDVIGGFAVGTVWVVFVALGDRLAERRRLRV